MRSDLVFVSKLVVATRNKGKAAEFRTLLAPLGIEVLSLLEAGGAVPEVDEDRETFAGNAEKKARAAAEALGLPALADDSGLCVDALGGEPGVRSARYAGEPSSDERNNAKLLRELAAAREAGGATSGGGGDVALSPARFVCALALYDPATGETVRAEGSCEGVIVPEPRGESGFGYDPLFFVPELGKTFAEMTEEEKNRISHRGRALAQLRSELERMSGGNGGGAF
ncbi:RdgB/HAM1 family non-canonical purine NTP pyrophosphatase [Paenibacillus thermotolerans]|uniref:RdgB/HAM1 family non-canonical purine NTP pyrophosphatase n=1 Tax=Paenibacillus thermotolerans TaxID=3027807 RepID=UPI002368F112|nr:MULTISPECIES: RdgB/HAM1 family non-canonical purine NTP pyrophosphatase [unclassified Paenibacillus]